MAGLQAQLLALTAELEAQRREHEALQHSRHGKFAGQSAGNSPSARAVAAPLTLEGLTSVLAEVRRTVSGQP